jgi:lipopolysaccharide biosynthesis glycosyltransferase
MQPERHPSKYPVAVCFDEAYLPGALTLIGSLQRHLPPFHLHILYDSLPASAGDQVRRAFPTLTVEMHRVTLPPGLRKIGWLSPMTSARLLIPELVAGDRCLYVDVDTLCVGDLSPVFDLDLQGRPLAAVIDDYDVSDRTTVFRGYWRVPLEQVPASGWPGRPLPPLFCPAFMLMDLAQWRRERITERYFDWLLAHQPLVRLPNITGLNNIVRGDFLELPHEFHASTLCHGPGAEGLDPTAVRSIHYAGPQKPWNAAPPAGMANLWNLWWRSAERVGVTAMAGAFPTPEGP